LDQELAHTTNHDTLSLTISEEQENLLNHDNFLMFFNPLNIKSLST